MIPAVDERLCDVGGMHLVLQHLLGRGHDALMHAGAVVGDIVNAAQLVHDVVGVEDCVLTGLLKALAAKGADVAVRFDYNAEVAVKALDLADGIGPVVIKAVLHAVVLGLLCGDAGHGHEGDKVALHADRAGAGAAAAVRGGEGLVQVDVHHVKAHIAGTDYAHYGVEVRTVVIEQTARLVDDLCDLFDVALEKAERGGVGQHKARGIGADGLPEGVKVHAAVGSGLDLLDLEAGHGGGGGVGAVRRIGHYHDLALKVAAVLVIGADMHKAGQLAVSAGSGLQGERVHTADLAEHLLHIVHQFKAALSHLGVEQGMHVVKQGGKLLVDFGIVLHGTRAQGVEAVVHAEVAARKVGVVANKVHFAQLGQGKRRGRAKLLGYLVHGVGRVAHGQIVRPASLMRTLKNQLIFGTHHSSPPMGSSVSAIMSQIKS